ncbi:MAG: HU family DNA-binding protein [Eubacteriales bacterium]|nr:HU family DNA-binding protein [Eubacteriales bacterium]
MTKVEFIKAVASEAGVTQDMAAKCYDAVFATIKEELAKGEKVAVAGFGNFEVKTTAARTGKNPATGETIQIPAGKKVSFKAGKVLKDSL